MALVELSGQESEDSGAGMLLYSRDHGGMDYGTCSEAESVFSDATSRQRLITESQQRHVVFYNISYSVSQQYHCFRKLSPKKLLHHVRQVPGN